MGHNLKLNKQMEQRTLKENRDVLMDENILFGDKFFIEISGPSGAGKNSIMNWLLAKDSRFKRAVSRTTRPQDFTKETQGRDYYFDSKEAFLLRTQLSELPLTVHESRERFLEWEEVHGNYYGMTIREIMRITESGWYPINDVDPFGTLKLKKRFPNKILALFIAPPSREIALERIQKRARSGDDLTLRMERYDREIVMQDQFDKVFINHSIEDTGKEVYEYILSIIEKSV